MITLMLIWIESSSTFRYSKHRLSLSSYKMLIFFINSFIFIQLHYTQKVNFLTNFSQDCEYNKQKTRWSKMEQEILKSAVLLQAFGISGSTLMSTWLRDVSGISFKSSRKPIDCSVWYFFNFNIQLTTVILVA